MFDVLGIRPLLLNCLLVFTFFMLAFFIGSIFKKNSNKGLSLIIGATLIISLYAVLNTGIKSFFTPILFVTPLLLKIDFTENYLNKIKNAVRNSLSTFLLFVVILIITIIQFEYFSSAVVVSNYPDFTFYTLIAENLKTHNVESPYNYLINYGYEVGSTVYHYFDLYVLALFSEFNESIFLIYTYLYYPLINTIAVVLIADLLSLSNLKGKKMVNYIIAIIAVYAPSYGIDNGELVGMTSYYMPKIIFALIVFYLLFQSIIHKNFPLLAFCIIVCFVMNILLLAILIVLIAFIAIYYFININKRRMDRMPVFSQSNKLAFFSIVFVYLYYFVILITAKSEISLLTTNADSFLNSFVSPDYFMLFIERLIGYLAALKYRYLFLLAFICLFYFYYKYRKPSSLTKLFVFVFLFATSGHLLSAILVFHSESHQLHQLSFELMFLISSAIALKFITFKDITSKTFGYLSALYILFGLFYFDFKSFVQPAERYINSKVFFGNLYNELKKNDNILYLEKINTDKWRRNIPYWIYEVGIFKTKANISLLKPLSEGMYENEVKKTYPENWKTGLRNSPFNLFCIESGYYPESFYDKDFELAIIKFIKKYNFDAIVLNGQIKEPNWLNKLSIKTVILPFDEHDSHRVYFLR